MKKILFYICHTFSREFRLMGTAKIIAATAIPWLYDKATPHFNLRPLSSLEIFALSAFTFTGFLLWAIAKRAQEIEEPKLTLFTINHAELENSLCVGIKNTAAIVIEGVEVEFVGYAISNQDFYQPINTLISIDRHSTLGRFTINGGCEKRFQFGYYTRHQAKNYTDENRLLECRLNLGFDGGSRPLVLDREYIFTFRFSGATSPAVITSITVTADSDQRPTFKLAGIASQ